jgi:hypothetical protein
MSEEDVVKLCTEFLAELKAGHSRCWLPLKLISSQKPLEN